MNAKAWFYQQSFTSADRESATPTLPVKLCDTCSHLESQHAPADFDFNGECYVPDPRPCLIPDCPCKAFWQ